MHTLMEEMKKERKQGLFGSSVIVTHLIYTIINTK